MFLKRIVGDFEGRVNQTLLLKGGGQDKNEGPTGEKGIKDGRVYYTEAKI